MIKFDVNSMQVSSTSSIPHLELRWKNRKKPSTETRRRFGSNFWDVFNNLRESFQKIAIKLPPPPLKRILENPGESLNPFKKVNQIPKDPSKSSIIPKMFKGSLRIFKNLWVEISCREPRGISNGSPMDRKSCGESFEITKDLSEWPKCSKESSKILKNP